MREPRSLMGHCSGTDALLGVASPSLGKVIALIVVAAVSPACGGGGGDGVSSNGPSTPAPSVHWTNPIIDGAAGSPSARGKSLFVWDGTRGILFGGGIVAPLIGIQYSDTWWYDPGTSLWVQRIASGVGGSPLARESAAGVWTGSRLILFGGWWKNQSLSTGDTWSYDPSTNTWTELIAAGTAGSPTARQGHKMIWDGSRILMFGGYTNSTNTYNNDLWAYNPGTNTWAQVIANGDPSAPTPRQDFDMVWDGTGVILFGGAGSSGTPLSDLWRYNPGLLNWSLKFPTGGTPGGRVGHSLVWDGTDALMFGGKNAGSGTYTGTSDAWAYNPTANTWSLVVADGEVGSPNARFYHRSVWDGTRMIMFGGATLGGTASTSQDRNSLWWYQ